MPMNSREVMILVFFQNFSFQPSYNLPHILPSSVCPKPCVFTLFKETAGVGSVLPNLELTSLASAVSLLDILGSAYT